MADREIRETARAVERSVVPPDFGEVVARGQRIGRHRHRRQVAASAAAVVLVGTAILVPWSRLGLGQEPRSAGSPGETDGQRAALILSDPEAVVGPDATWVSDTGAVLQRVSIPSPLGRSCEADRRSALVWHDQQGDRRAWSEDVVGRAVAAVPGGFVVGAVTAPCAAALGTDAARTGAYTVDVTGASHEVSWRGDAETRCAVTPARAGCAVDASSATGSFVAGASGVPGPGFLPLGGPAGLDRWAASTDGRELAWTRDGGRTWDRHRTTLRAIPGDVVQSTASGPVGVFFAWPRVEVTRDHGRTWQVRDLESALTPVLVANPVLTVTADGVLAGVSYPTTGRPFVFAATDASWTRFERSDFRTSLGDYLLEASGAWLWTEDQHSVWVSRDGIRWREVDAVAAPGAD